MSQLHELLEQLRKDAGLRPTDISRQIGRSPSYWRKLMETKSTPGSDTLARLARVLGVNVSVLMSATDGERPGGQAPASDGGRNAVQEVSQPIPAPFIANLPRDLPVLGTASGSVFGATGGAWQLTGDPIDYLRRPPALLGATEAYALFVENSSMSPRYEPGEPVYVHPRQPPRPGDDVIIQVLIGAHQEAETFIKRLARLNSQIVECRQFNPEQTIEFPRKFVQVLHRVIPPKELMGF